MSHGDLVSPSGLVLAPTAALSELRDAARALLLFACNGTRGRSELDPVYLRVVEHRDVGAMRARYSSCGDLAHWLLYRMGVRSAYVNRAEHKPPLGRGWLVGMNVALLVKQGTGPIPGETYDCGDILRIGTPGQNNDHIMVALEHDPITGSLRVAEYGQPGGKVNTRRIEQRADRLFVGSRQLRTVLRLQDALLRAEAEGRLVDVDAATLAEAQAWAKTAA